MKNEWPEAMVFVAFFVCITLLFVLFAGTPDLMDKIVR